MLEIGCGTGEYANLFAQHAGLHVVAADICVPFIEEARRLYQSTNLQFECIDFTDTAAINAQFGDQAFDSVVGNGILHHMYSHIDEVLSKLHALLKPGGRFAFLEPNLYNPYIATIFQIPLARKWARLEPSEMAFSASFIAERLQKASLSELVAWQQRWLHDLLSLKLGARVRYFPHQQQVLGQLAARVSAERLQQAVRDAAMRRAVSDHPLSARLFIEQMLLEYTGLFR
jgi:2-polyprenyl-3-methyl-5-hydroxy-6-metoxy-1,4-benzoquinol methylase